jgi:hypothetical protein
MKPLALVLLFAVLSGCTENPPPAPISQPTPDNAGAPSANMPYRPVMAGTAYHGIGSKP